jgi:hypothetical protein
MKCSERTKHLFLGLKNERDTKEARVLGLQHVKLNTLCFLILVSSTLLIESEIDSFSRRTEFLGLKHCFPKIARYKTSDRFGKAPNSVKQNLLEYLNNNLEPP